MFISKHSRVVYKHHPAEALKTGTQKILKLQENDRKCHVEDEWLRNGRMFVFFSEQPVNYKPEFLWKVNVICITLFSIT